MFDARHKCLGAVFFGQLKYAKGAITHHGDNLTGAGTSRPRNPHSPNHPQPSHPIIRSAIPMPPLYLVGEGDDERISIQLSRVPVDVDTLFLVVNSYRYSVGIGNGILCDTVRDSV